MAKILRRKSGSTIVIITSQGKRRMLGIAKHAKREFVLPAGVRYSFLQDVLTRTVKPRIKRIGNKSFFVTPSSSPKGIPIGEVLSNACVVKTNGKPDSYYYTKQISPNSPVLFIKDQRDRKSRLLERNQLQDAERQKGVIQTPDYWAQIILPKAKRTVTVSTKIENAIPIDVFYQKASSTERQVLIKELRRVYGKLIQKGLFPSQNKPDQIWVKQGKKPVFVVTDSSIGPTPSYRNKYSLLRALLKYKDFPRPNWDNVEKSFSNLTSYWISLSRKYQKLVLSFELEQLVQEVEHGTKIRKSWMDIRADVRKLIIKVFPNSISAHRILRDRK